MKKILLVLLVVLFSPACRCWSQNAQAADKVNPEYLKALDDAKKKPMTSRRTSRTWPRRPG